MIELLGNMLRRIPNVGRDKGFQEDIFKLPKALEDRYQYKNTMFTWNVIDPFILIQGKPNISSLSAEKLQTKMRLTNGFRKKMALSWKLKKKNR